MTFKHLCIITNYPSGATPSQRFRFEQYLPHLQSAGFKITLLPFLKQSNRKFTQLSGLRKGFTLLSAIINRFLQLRLLSSADFILIHREALPAGPPLFEWFISKIQKKKIVYDFDDAIWLTDNEKESQLERFIRYRNKVRMVCNWSYKISCGNRYLSAFARQYNQNVIVNPTTIDTETLHNPSFYSTKKDDSQIVIGWTGSRSTLKYLEELQPVLKAIEAKYPSVSFLAISDIPPKLDLKSLEFRVWSINNEIRDLLALDIGIMPLPDNEWTHGKCGFKALQYMALQIPAVVSAVGVNTEIVDEGINGYLCTTAEHWFEKLERLIIDGGLRKRMGRSGRKKVIEAYSVKSNELNFLSLFR